MLDNDTKKRIDDCRDILVGKLPDPKAQIEQITIGLIYKFMDDMDKESIELGGKAKFFTDYKVPNPDFPEDRSKDELVEFKKYSWDKLLHPKVSAADMLRLYSEAIEKMEKNPNIPQLFRDIFNNAYLPYRDPETLKLFLKTINGFEYTHSEKLGDAFEYLLSVMGSQGDAGQFRTPRHIIDFLVEIVDPGKKDSILDPACGTAGFLISAFKHIRNKNKGGFTPEEQKRLIKNFVGYDISPDMVRLSLVNLYLHGFTDPHIHEYDTLSSEDRWNESYDVILANPPFMSPKGGIRPHKKFSISSNRSEVLFVDYIAEHLNPDGKAGVIVPEGIIFQSSKAYKDLRKTLVEGSLYAVVSLPAGVFNPYSGVKTSILLMDKAVAKKTDKVLFVKIDNDGYNLGAQRTAVKGGQLEEAVATIQKFRNGEDVSSSEVENAHAVLKTEIAANGDYNLSGERYRNTIEINSDYQLVPISEICDSLFAGGDAPKEYSKTETNKYNVPIYSNGVGEKSLYGYADYGRVEEDAVTISARGTIGYPIVRKAPFLPIVRLIVAIPNTSKVNIHYLKLALDSIEIYRNGNSIPQLTVPMIRDEKIPLPPLSIQEEIVAEIEGYQKIIDGAKAVVANYKPKIDIDPDWEMVELGEVCDSISDGDHQPPPKSEEGIPFITISNIKGPSEIDFSKTFHVPVEYYNSLKPHRRPMIGDILYTVTGSYGTPVLVDFDKKFCFQRHVGLIRPGSHVDSRYLFYYLQTTEAVKQADQAATGVAQKTVSLKSLRRFQIPFPDREVQLKIVERITYEQELVNANKQLIEIFEQKIKDRIAKVWGEEKQAEPEVAMAAEPEVEYKQ